MDTNPSTASITSPVDEEENNVNKAQDNPKLNISEPVISFVDCMKSNPKRFGYSRDYSRPARRGLYCTIYHKIRDKKTKQEWTITDYSFDIYRGQEKRYEGWPSFLTKKEEEYLLTEVSAIFEARTKRLHDLLGKRKQREADKERQRLLTVYCKE